jgi:uncharacterized tellurite resistance protein B-like protein
MRHYDTDTPEALARIIAAVILADGGLDKTELRSLENNAALQRLGIGAAQFDRVVHEFCDDMHVSSLRAPCGQQVLDREAIDRLLSEVRSPPLQISLLAVLLDVVNADARQTPEELTLLSQAMTRWGLELHEVSSHRGPVTRSPTSE